MTAQRATRTAAVALLALLAAPAHAVSCSVSTAGLAFGAYDVLSTVPLVSTVTVRIACARDAGDSPVVRVAATIALSAGLSGSHAQRQMAGGSQRLNYNVFTTSGYGTVWGDGSGGSVTRSASLQLTPGQPSAFVDLTGHGRVPALQDVAPGTYADALVVTVEF